ncbi:LPXTG cell wall anchor domain-containing protein, partial [Streptococcus sp. IMAU 99125]
KPDEKVVVQDKSHLTPEEKKQVEDKVKAKNPGKTVTVGDDGTATVTDLEIGISHDIVGEEMTLIAPPTVELPEFKGGVNGELPDPITLPELTIEVRWIDEDGNVLKPSVKTGNEKDVEHGSIPGYEFVRTVIDENEPVITHIFRKVSGSTNPNTIPVTPVTPDTNRGSGQDAPAPTTPVPDAVTPNADQVDTKTTVDNGAKSNGSQNVLPNTGTESNATLASLGLLGMLGGLGLALAKKKED